MLRSSLTGSLLATLFCSAPVPTPAPAQGGARARPTLLVFITVDQMREDYVDRWRGQLTGGLKRLAEGGAFFTNGHQDHAITETAPGHASTMSGRFPRSTGISRNLAGVNDSTSHLIGSGELGASPMRFRGTTLTDWLSAANSHTRALSVSAKDRGAILPIGRSKQHVYWLPFSSDSFLTTSTWYADTLPDWVKGFNARRIPQRSAGRIWNLLLGPSQYAEPDSVPIESGGRDFVFPHQAPSDTVAAARAFRGFPWMDELLLAFGLEGLQRLNLGKGPQADILAISLSTTDYVGHRFGPDSREIHDQILRLDRALGAFMDSLYKLRDSSKVIFALTGDHGVAPFPELNNGRISPAPKRVNVLPALQAAQRVIQAGGGGGNPAALDLESGALLVNRAGVGVEETLLRAAVDSFLAVARRIPGVLRADRFADLAKADPGKDAVARRWVQMFAPDAGAEAAITLTPGSYWEPYPVAMHGTPHDADTHVPIIFFGPPFKPGRYPQFVRTVDLAPTLAQVLGVVPSEPLDGRVLTVGIR
jgi:predicted AlkP superfamily pyrophosphatase or phosphodiesterase